MNRQTVSTFALAFAAALASASCGSSGSGNPTNHTTGTTDSSTSGGDDSTTSPTDSGGSMTDSGATGDDSTTTTPGADATSDAGAADACKPPGSLHPPKADAGPGTIYCPFSGVDGGKAEYCTPGTQHCCETPAGSTTASACQPSGTTCVTGSVDWACEDPKADCTDPSKPVCCAPGASIGLGAPGCANFAHKMTGTSCVAAGGCSGIVMCTDDTECPSGQHCTPFGKAGNQVGGCM